MFLFSQNIHWRNNKFFFDRKIFYSEVDQSGQVEISAHSVWTPTQLTELKVTFCTLLCRPAAGESGSADTVRDPRGFAVKFYTEEGNWDLTGNNTPIFFIKDALLVSGWLRVHMCVRCRPEVLHWCIQCRHPNEFHQSKIMNPLSIMSREISL